MKNPHKIVLITMFAVIFAVLPVLTFVFMPKELNPFSENENRYLSPWVKPIFTGRTNNIKNNRFMTAFDNWFADRFVARESWIILKNDIEILSGKTEINGVFTGKERIIEAWRDYDEKTVNASLDAIDSFAANTGIPCVFLLAPTAQEIYADSLPVNAVVGNQKAFIKYCCDYLENASCADALTPLYDNRDKYVYYRTDHHWTSYGAYIGYYAACAKLGLTPYELGSFNIEHASSDFRGTLYSKALGSKVTLDIIDYYTLSVNPPEVALAYEGKEGAETSDSLYFREYLSQKDKYASFLGQNNPKLEITTGLENNDRSLLIIKDSYANSLIPFLANHYKYITVLDMRYINVDVRTVVNLDEYEQALFLYNAMTFSKDENLKYLSLVK